MDGPLIRNLQHAMEIFGDPSQQFRLVDREAKLLIIVANIGIEPDRQWPKIEPNIRGRCSLDSAMRAPTWAKMR